jgi:hypothetical protein
MVPGVERHAARVAAADHEFFVPGDGEFPALFAMPLIVVVGAQ